MTAPLQRIAIAAVTLVMVAQFAARFAQSPGQLMLAFGAAGLVLGTLFSTGHRHLITGYAVGLALILTLEFITYGPVVQVTGPVYLAGDLFAIAAGLTGRFARVQLPAWWRTRKHRQPA